MSSFGLVIRLYAKNKEEAEKRIADAVEMGSEAMATGCRKVYFIVYRDEKDPASDFGETKNLIGQYVMPLNLGRNHEVIETAEDPFVGQLNLVADRFYSEELLNYMVIASPEAKVTFLANIQKMKEVMDDECPRHGGNAHVIALAVESSEDLVLRGRPDNQICAWYLQTLIDSGGFSYEDRRRKPEEPIEWAYINKGTPQEVRHPLGGVETVAPVINFSNHLKHGGFITVLERRDKNTFAPYTPEQMENHRSKVATKQTRQDLVCQRLGFPPELTHLFVGKII